MEQVIRIGMDRRLVIGPIDASFTDLPGMLCSTAGMCSKQRNHLAIKASNGPCAMRKRPPDGLSSAGACQALPNLFCGCVLFGKVQACAQRVFDVRCAGGIDALHGRVAGGDSGPIGGAIGQAGLGEGYPDAMG